MKHLDLRYYWLRDTVNTNCIAPSYIPTAEQIADILTKPLPSPKVRFCWEAMGIQLWFHIIFLLHTMDSYLTPFYLGDMWDQGGLLKLPPLSPSCSKLFQNVPEHSSMFWTFVPDSCHFPSFFDVSCHCSSFFDDSCHCSSFFDNSCHCSSFFDNSCHCYCSLMTAVILIVLVLIVLQIYI